MLLQIVPLLLGSIEHPIWHGVVTAFCEASCDASFTAITVQMLAAIVIGLGLAQTTGGRASQCKAKIDCVPTGSSRHGILRICLGCRQGGFDRAGLEDEKGSISK